MHPTLHSLVAAERHRELEERSLYALSVEQPACRRRLPTVTIRPASRRDLRALRRIAALEERSVPPGRLLVAELDGTIEAALPVEGGRVLTNPFAPAADIVPLLELRAEQERRAA